jgi:pentatricopeptide repeat protein
LKCTGTKVVPTKEMFDACLNAWVSYPTPNAGERSELLVLKMLQLSEAGYDTKPNYKSYSKIVHAWVNSKNEYALSRVDKIMETMERMDWSSENNDHLSEQVAQTYHAAMKLCSFRVRSNWAVKKCVEYLSRLDKALGLQNVEHVTLQLLYSALIYTYAQSEVPETETRVEEIFREMEVRHKKYVDEKLASKAGEEEDYYPYLSMYFYRAILQAFAKTGSGHKAEALLKRMMHEYLDSMEKYPTDSDSIHKIDISCVNSVLLAWSRSTEADAGHHAEKLFRQIYQSQSAKHLAVRMDVVSYNAVLTAMSGSTDIDVARRGDAYFRQILESSDPKCQASVVTYTKAISLWSNIGTSEALKRADELLNEMKASKKLKPSKHTYLAYKDVLRKCKACLPLKDYDDRLRETNQMIKKL